MADLIAYPAVSSQTAPGRTSMARLKVSIAEPINRS
jgi:hypothetical protein